MLIAVPLAFAGGIGGAGGGGVSSPVGVSDGGTGLTSGTSGGVPYFSASGTMASSDALAANSLVKGGGAGAAPATITTGTGVLTALGNTANASGGFLTYDAELAALGGLTSAADKIPYFTGSGTAGLVTIGSGLTFSGGTLSSSATGDGLTLTGTKTAAYTAAAGDHVLCDANGAAADFAVTLPATPSNGDRVRVSLITQHATRKVTISDNGSNIMGGGSNDVYYTLLVNGDTVEFKYVGGTAGWVVAFDGIGAQVCTICSNTAQTGLAVNTINAVTLGTSVVDRGGIAVTGSNAITLRRAVRSGTIVGQATVGSFSTTPVVNQGSYIFINLNGTRIKDGITQSTSVGAIPHGSTTRAFAAADSFTMDSYASAVSGTYATADNTYGQRSELSFVEHR